MRQPLPLRKRLLGPIPVELTQVARNGNEVIGQPGRLWGVGKIFELQKQQLIAPLDGVTVSGANAAMEFGIGP